MNAKRKAVARDVTEYLIGAQRGADAATLAVIDAISPDGLTDLDAQNEALKNLREVRALLREIAYAIGADEDDAKVAPLKAVAS